VTEFSLKVERAYPSARALVFFILQKTHPGEGARATHIRSLDNASGKVVLCMLHWQQRRQKQVLRCAQDDKREGSGRTAGGTRSYSAGEGARATNARSFDSRYLA
jgi:hypothetical protein